MPTNDVEFRISADTKPAGRALVALKKELEKLSAVKSVDSRVIKQQRDLQTVLKGITETYDKFQGKFKLYEANIANVKNLTKALEDQQVRTQEAATAWEEFKQKQAKGETGLSAKGEYWKERKLREQVTVELAKEAEIKKTLASYQARVNELDTASAQTIRQLLGDEKEIVRDEQSILGFKIQKKTITQQEELAAEQEARAVEEVGKRTKQASAEAQKQATAQKEVAETTKKSSGAEAKAADISKKHEEEVKKLIDAYTAYQQKIAQVQIAVDNLNRPIADNDIAGLAGRLSQLTEAKRILDKLGVPGEYRDQYKQIYDGIERTKQAINDYKRSLSGTVSAHEKAGASGKSFYSSTEKGSRKLVTSLGDVRKVVDAVKRGFSKLSGITSKMRSSFDGMARNMKSNFKHLITSLTKYVLGFRSLFFLVRRLRKYLGEGIKNLAQWNNGNNIVNESITDLLSSLLFLKNAWAAAFAPIITVVRPILVSLIDSIAEVGNAIARLLSALLGQEVAFNAVRIKAADYAESLDNVGGSAGGAADRTKKLTDRLAAFDDLNVLGVDNDPDGTGSGGSGGSADAYTPDVNEMFKIVDSESNNVIEALITKIKQSWKDADFSDIGSIISGGIVYALENKIDWEKIQATANKVGSSVGSFLAGLFGDPALWESAGKTIGEAMNTITGAISAFLDKTEGIDFGGNVAKSINEWLKTTDFETAGNNINRAFTQITDNINSFLDTLSDEELSQSITDFIEKVDLPDLLEKAGKTTIKLLGKLVIVSANIISDLGYSLGDKLYLWVQGDLAVSKITMPGTDEEGNEVSVPLALKPEIDMTEDPVGALVDAIYTKIGQFTVEGILGVDSVDKLYDFADGFDQLKQAIIDFGWHWSDVALLITGNPFPVEENLFGPTEEWDTLRIIFDAISISLGNIFALFDLLDMNGISPDDIILLPDELYDIGNKIGEAFDTADWGEVWNDFWDNDFWNEDKQRHIDDFMGAHSEIQDTVGKTVEKVKGDFQSLNDDLLPTLQSIKDTMVSKFFEAEIFLASHAAQIYTKVSGEFNKLKDDAYDVWENIRAKAVEKFIMLRTGIVTCFEVLKEKVKDPINGFIDVIEKMVNKVIDAINAVFDTINAVTGLGSDLAKAAGFPTGIGKISHLSHIDIPHLAQGAVIPPNREFMAVLGDQSHGTNIEAPLDTIKQAVAEVLANNGNQEVIQLLQQLIGVVESKDLTIGDKQIGLANARYTAQQNRIRGTSF